MTRLTFTPVLVAGLLLAACGGDGSTEDPTTPETATVEAATGTPATEATAPPPAGTDEDTLQAGDTDAREILMRSQVAMAALSSLHMSQRIKQQLAGTTIDLLLEMDIELPDRSYTVVTSPELSFELVTEGLDVYVRLPGQNWQTYLQAFGFSLAEIGFNLPDPTAQLDLAGLAETVELLGESMVDGVPTHHLRATFNFETYMVAAAELLGAGGSLGEAFESAEGDDVVIEYHIGRDDFLLRAGETTLALTVLGIQQSVETEIVLSAFDEPVDIPDAAAAVAAIEFPPSTTTRSILTLETGACFSATEALLALGEVAVIPCDELHEFEIYFAVEHEDGPFPGGFVLAGFAEEKCLAAFEPYVGSLYDYSEIFADYMLPTVETWLRGDRTTLCVLFLPGELITGGSLRGSGR